jgi:hypothetical protein
MRTITEDRSRGPVKYTDVECGVHVECGVLGCQMDLEFCWICGRNLIRVYSISFDPFMGRVLVLGDLFKGMTLQC